MAEFNKLAETVFQGDFDGVKRLTQVMLDEGVEPIDIIDKGLLAGMEIVAPKFKAGEMFVPEVMMSANALHQGMNLVKASITDGNMQSKGKIVIGTVAGDLHDIGKNLLITILESGAYDVIDLGIDVSTEKFIEAIKEHKPQVVGMSALLTSTMHALKEGCEAIKAEGLDVKILVGGAPVSQSFADEIGADGYSADALAAKDMVKEMINSN